MRLMITRPLEDAKPLADELATHGIETVIEPLLSIELSRNESPDLSDVQALLLTSANGVRAFASLSFERALPVYAVGDATARAAIDAGFESVDSASGDVDALAELARERLVPTDGALLHIAGSKVAGDLAGLLAGADFTYRRKQLYHAAKATSLSDEAISAFKDGRVDGVILYSPRTAENFVDLLQKAGAADCAQNMRAYCLSAAVAAKVSVLDWGRVIIAKTPNQAALINSIKKIT